MVKSLIVLAMLPRLISPTKDDIESLVNNYINNTCQYLKYEYNETNKAYELYDKIYLYNEQNQDTTFHFTIYLDYIITERITHFWNIGEGITIKLADPVYTGEGGILGVCENILALDIQENKFKIFNLIANNWETNEATVLNEIPSNKITDTIYVLNKDYANNSELYKAGYGSGYSIGYNTGYGDGKIATTPLNNTFDLFKNIATSLSSFWNIQILPGINIGLLISIPITTGIVIWVIKALKE